MIIKRKRLKEEMKEKDITEVVFIMDRSGSMAGLEADTIGGFNSMLEKQQKEGGDIIWSTVLFDHVTEVLHDRVSISKIPKITTDDYYVRGSTALLDAVGGAIRHIGNIHKYARDEDRPSKTMFVITTDGMENASVIYGYRDVKRMIEHEKKKYGWEFIFLGANMDAVGVAGRMGIGADRSVRFHNDTMGIALNYDVMSEELCAFISNGEVGSRLERVREDYKKRK